MDSTVVGGLIGIGGTVVGAAVTSALTSRRERRQARARRRRAVSAVVRELISTLHIFDLALTRQAWWPEGDDPPREEWETYRDDLAAELDLDTFNKISFVYDSVRSLVATRSEPLSPTVGDWSLSGLRARWHLRKDKERRSFFHHIWTPDRWPQANAEVTGARAAVIEAIEILRPVQLRLLKRRERKRREEMVEEAPAEEEAAREAQALEEGVESPAQ